MNGTESRLTAEDRSELAALFMARVKFDEPVAPFTSWKIGGPADALIAVETSAELGTLLRFCLRRRLGWFILGYGSNLLVGDGGMRGVVIRLTGEFTDLRFTESEQEITVEAGGAASLAQLAGQGASRGAVGVDGIAGIPGSVGGAVRMNAGTDREMGEFVRDVTIQSPSRPVAHQISPQYFYRRSTLPRDAVVVSATLVFARGDVHAVRERLQERLIRRKSTQPIALPNAGSCFRNPDGDRAGRLIEAAGLKGSRVGGAYVSEMHANFIVNDGTASAQDVAMLLTRVRRGVAERFAVELIPEVHFVGVFTADEPVLAGVQ